MRQFRSAFAALALALAAAAPAAANPAEVGAAIPNAQTVGQAPYRFLGITLFQAELFAAGGDFSWQQPFALTLTYQHSARQSLIINRSIVEMSQRGAGSAQTLAPLRAQLERCFPNVQRDDRITGVSTSADAARFYVNGARSCTVEWPNFRRHFFGIWLDARGGQAAMSARLRGET
ncbi:MAG: chalcone isomerase family protein [Hyphomonadaceae bacterium]|nr:chalcone isomerase family protein [Hyphomonadaceae bacterium]